MIKIKSVDHNHDSWTAVKEQYIGLLAQDLQKATDFRKPINASLGRDKAPKARKKTNL